MEWRHQLQRLLGSLVSMVGPPTNGKKSRQHWRGRSCDLQEPTSIHWPLSQCLCMRYSCTSSVGIEDDGGDSLHKNQYVFLIDKRNLLVKHRRVIPVEGRIDGTHGRRQRRVCTDLGGCIQSLSGENQEASFSVNIDMPSRVRLRTVVFRYRAPGHADKSLAPLIIEGLLTQRSFAEISKATQSLQIYGLLMIY